MGDDDGSLRYMVRGYSRDLPIRRPTSPILDEDQVSDSLRNVPFLVSEIPEKGMGLVAARLIATGAPFFTERPLFTQPSACTNSTILGELALHTRDEQREFFSLSNKYKSGRKVLPGLGIFRTNAVPCPIMKANCAEERLGLFFAAARLNHSCTPNVSRVWDSEEQVLKFYALRHIGPGEELCISYLDVLETRDERRAELWSHFGFECACSVCTLQGTALEESDYRRAAIRRLYNEMCTCTNEPEIGIQKASGWLNSVVELPEYSMIIRFNWPCSS
ncbi:uncharacterized protein FIBRA_02267 [Fibroporia radiculosa]|uniref:SET domain-containing protein n=1 Tax=Fibroporia radiculosa TaxID=599839 RepID=J4G1H6_9APHY|nr:uncharacterized protein FIBRA_02267 [Fibroporia radiculosa]CCM00238.1 predicted protein [Fibroporia radiculosa]